MPRPRDMEMSRSKEQGFVSTDDGAATRPPQPHPRHTQPQQRSCRRKPRNHGPAGTSSQEPGRAGRGQGGPEGLTSVCRPCEGRCGMLECSRLIYPWGWGGQTGLLQPGQRWGQGCGTGPGNRKGSGRKPWPHSSGPGRLRHPCGAGGQRSGVQHPSRVWTHRSPPSEQGLSGTQGTKARC